MAYLFIGVLFGVILTKGEIVSWFRMQEMFRFQGFYMFGVFATAVPTAMLTVQVLKRRQMRALSGEAISVVPKVFGSGRRYLFGGVLFGIGWALTGACPGPLFALLGSGVPVMIVVITSALLGTWTYGAMRPHLPH